MIRNLFIFILSSLCVATAGSAGLNCLQIEGLNLGCVSSVDHSCFLNRTVDKKSDCTYGSGWSARHRVEGPIAFACKSYSNTTTTEHVPARGCCPGMACTPGDTCSPAHDVTVTHSECLEYQPPVCDESCVNCYENVQAFPTGWTRGCIVCTRASCADEPEAKNFCPALEGKTLLGTAKKCSSDARCPTTAVDPNGRSHPVTITGSGACVVGPEPTPPPPEVMGDYCPWKADKRTGGTKTSAGNCECITEDNWNTKLGPWPGCP